MLYSLVEIDKIDNFLRKLCEAHCIDDYRIIVKYDFYVNLYVISNTLSESDFAIKIEGLKGIASYEIISSENANNDSYYKSIFSQHNNIDLSERKKLNSALENNEEKISTPCPVITFYSYKGGVGRSTTLIMFSAYYAFHYSKKVFIVDCDFEAPGLINFFNSYKQPGKNGLVEFIKDKEAGYEIPFSEYVYDIPQEFSGDGKIFLLSAGNIFSEKDRKHYLEALARFESGSKDFLVDYFKTIIDNIYRYYSPDIIVFDSRTGFNDTVGVLIRKFSTISLGIFGNDYQNKPGINFFLDTVFPNCKSMNNTIIAQAITHNYSKGEREAFSSYIYEYLNSNIFLDETPVLPIFYIPFLPVLNNIGAESGDWEGFMDSIKKKEFSRHNDIFDSLILILGKKTSKAYHHIADDTVSDSTFSNVTSSPSVTVSDESTSESNSKDANATKLLALKKEILKQMVANYPQSYAEKTQFDSEFIDKKFFIRSYMKEIFSPTNQLFIGGKGTGKTTFYRALNQTGFVEKFKDICEKHNKKYFFINAIGIGHEEFSHDKKFFPISLLKNKNGIDDELFYRCFWTIYIWLLVRPFAIENGFPKCGRAREVAGN